MSQHLSSNGSNGLPPRGSRIESGLELTARALTDIVSGSDPLVLRYLEEFAQNRGKLLRPRLLISIAELFGGGNLHSLANCSACCELLHIATLIHDDVIDEADTRRGSPTLSSRFGNEIAVIVGDYALALVLRSLNSERDFMLNDMLLATSQELGMGVIEEVVNRNNLSMSVEKYYEVIYLKTAALFSLCCRIGARLGQAPPALVTQAGHYGKQLGLAFQIVDDLLDLTEDSAAIGKPAMSDIREGRVTLPLIHAFSQDEAGITALVSALQDGGGAAAEAAVRLKLSELGSLDYALAEARRFIAAARQSALQLEAAAVMPQHGAELVALEERVLDAVRFEQSGIAPGQAH